MHDPMHDKAPCKYDALKSNEIVHHTAWLDYF